jgi:hypothetical protein
MIRVASAVGLVTLILAVTARAQVPTPVPPPEMKQWDLWVGDWTMVGTAKDAPSEPEYQLQWRMQGRSILGGFFVEVSSTWNGKGPELSFLEILSYDPVQSIHAISGFASDGTTWVGTAAFSDGTSKDTGTDTGPDGKTTRWRNTWTVSPDGMSVSGKEEREQDGTWWTAFTVHGTRSPAGASRQ